MKSLLPAFYFPNSVLVIDDDELFVETIVRYLNQSCWDIKVLGFSDLREASYEINHLKIS